MYCYGSTITCTQYPKFFVKGKSHILPRPYFKSKPNQKGYKIIRTDWMQSLLKDIEYQVIYYLQNICQDHQMKRLTLFNIALIRKIITECLWLGNTCFNHMTVFGTLGKEDGELPLHFDERGIISCIFHLGKVFDGGQTSYFDGTSHNEPGNLVHQVNFKHGTLQKGFFNKVLHGVNSWSGQRCGIQVN